MATFTINVPNDKLDRVIQAYSQDWEENLQNGEPNPLTRAQHAKIEINRHIKQRVIEYEQRTYQLPDFDTSGITID